MLTDEEIIKALECCSDVGTDCKLCPLHDEYGDIHCVADLDVLTLELINRQKAEIDILIRKKNTLKDEIAEQKAEIERLKDLLKSVGEYINRLEKEMTE